MMIVIISGVSIIQVQELWIVMCNIYIYTLYIYIYVCIYVYMYIYICACICMYNMYVAITVSWTIGASVIEILYWKF